jgi:uncharacterized protein (TIGR03437 family)
MRSQVLKGTILKGTILFASLSWWFAAEQPLHAQAVIQDIQNIKMTNQGQIVSGGGRIAISPDNTKIAYDHFETSGPQTDYFNLYVANADGSNPTCLTCVGSPGASVLPGLMAGNPYWSPDGNFIVFQVQAGPSMGVGNDFEAFPGEGSWCDLWATDANGHFWQLTHQGRWGVEGILSHAAVTTGKDSLSCGCSAASPCTWTATGGGGTGATGTYTISGGNLATVTIAINGTGSGYSSNPTFVPQSGCGSIGTSTVAFVGSAGVIYPIISPDGTKLTWGQRLTPGKASADRGTWELGVATWSEAGGVPAISNINFYKPTQPGGPNGYYEPHTWSADSSTVFYMGNESPIMKSSVARDIYSYNPQTGTLVNLTNTQYEWYEFPTILPAVTSKLSYEYLPLLTSKQPCNSDLWIMNTDGTEKQQLTFFNTPGSPYYMPGGVCVADHRWNTNGSEVVMFSDQFDQYGHTDGYTSGPIWRLDIQPAFNATVNAASYRNPPVAADAIVSIYGADLANQTLAAQNAALPTNLGNTTVSIMDATGVARPATMYFVSSNQINVVVPAGTAPGPAVFEVTNPAGVQSSSMVDIAPISPAFYTANQNGKGAPSAYVQVVAASGSQTDEPVYSCPEGGGPCTTIPIDVSNSSDKYYLVLFGTGLRGRGSLQQVSATIGNQSVPVLYAGAQSQYEGFDQMILQIPNSLAGAGVVSVVANVNGAASNFVQIQIQ